MKTRIPKVKVFGIELDVEGKARSNYKKMKDCGKKTSKKMKDLI